MDDSFERVSGFYHDKSGKFQKKTCEFKLMVNTKNKDIIATRNMILNIEPSYTTINVLETLR